jgi:putative ABC transport system permease protein
VLVTAVIIQVKPWYKPQYFIPIGGMIIGNSMTAIAISLDRLFSDIKNQRDQIELFLSLGATYQEATVKIFRDAIQAGMIPSINAMMTVGLVKLPGMMTGQILGGVNPLVAVKYQIIVMLTLVASTVIGNVIVVYIVRKLCFTQAHQIAI